MNSFLFAWRQLTYSKARLAAALSGIAFAVLLMLVQLGFEQALFSSVTVLLTHLNADLFVVSKQYQSSNAVRFMPARRLSQTLSIDGVQSVASVYAGYAIWKNPATLDDRSIYVVAFNPADRVFNIPEVQAAVTRLQDPDTVLFDTRSRPEYGPISDLFQPHGSLTTELSGRPAHVVGLFPLGTSFIADGTVLTSDLNFVRYIPYRTLGVVDLGLITLKPGADARRVQAEIAATLPRDVAVFTRDDFLQKERNYWATNTPIGFVFRLGLAMGMLVGSIVVYQVLFTDVSEHLAEYATLKAIGLSDTYLFSLVLRQSFLLSLLGYIPGLGFSMLVYAIARRATLLPLEMNAGRAIVVYGLTFTICMLSGALVLRKLRRADPAEMFQR